MKRFFFTLLALCTGILADAQTRTYTDNANGTYVFGLDSYFYGESGSLTFEADGRSFQATVSPEAVTLGGQRLGGGGDVVIGIHDFTGNHVPEFVMAVRTSGSIGVWIYAFQAGRWSPLKMMSVRDAKEVRIFRQVLSIRRGEVLSSWTYHDGKFDYKASDGSVEP